MEDGKFLKSLYIVLTSLFYGSPSYIVWHSLFQILPIPTSPSTPTSTPTALSVVMFLWLNGDHTTFDLPFYLLIIWIYTYQALVRYYQKDLDMCFMQQGVKFTEV